MGFLTLKGKELLVKSFFHGSSSPSFFELALVIGGSLVNTASVLGTAETEYPNQLTECPAGSGYARHRIPATSDNFVWSSAQYNAGWGVVTGTVITVRYGGSGMFTWSAAGGNIPSTYPTHSITAVAVIDSSTIPYVVGVYPIDPVFHLVDGQSLILQSLVMRVD